MNPAHFKMLGYESREEFSEVGVSDLYQNPEDRTKFSRKLAKFGSVKNEELHLKKKDGSPLIGSVSAVAVKDENEKVLYFDGIVEDITERKKAEEALKKAHEELETQVKKRTAELTKTNKRLKTEINKRKPGT